MSSDFNKIAEVELRNLYLQMLDMYVSALKKSEFSAFNTQFLNVFDKPEGNVDIFSAESEEDFIAENIRDVSSTQELKELLNKQYDLFGVDTPAGGYLDIFSGATNWWKSSSEMLPSGYFSHVEVFDYDGSKIKSLTDSSKSFTFNINDGSIGSDLNNFLIQRIKESYIDSDDGDLNSDYLDLDKVSNKFFFALDGGKNSFHYKQGTPGKVYIRFFLNILGASLNYDAVKIEGIQELPKIPAGIKKNFLLKNFYSGIEAFKKEFSKNKKSTPTKILLEDFDKLRDYIKKVQQKKKLTDNSRISFVFFDDYRFQSLLDKNNVYIGTKEIKDFLRENTALNQQIAVLNQTNCLLGGKDKDSSTISIGNTPDNYEHFSSNNESYKKESESEKQKAKIYQASRSAWKYIGDLALRTAYEYIRKLVPGGNQIAQLYRQFFNTIDTVALAIDAAEDAAKKIPLPDVRRIYFEAFVYGLDITEIVDCLVGQAGESILVSPLGNEFNDLEFELKVLLYNRFSFFYNTAKSFDPLLFNFISNDEPLPTADTNISEIRSYSSKIQAARQAKNYTKEQELKEEYTALLARKEDINVIFQYISMIPEEQLSAIYTTIISNEPQYQYLPEYINRGMIKARDYPTFSSERFISSLFKASIIDYSRTLTNFQFLELYDNVSKKNKKLKTNAQIKKEDPRNLADIGDSAKKAKTKLHEPIKFDWFTKRYETYDIERAFIDGLEIALNQALELAIVEIIKLTTENIYNLVAGDEDAYDNVDPSIRDQATSNNLVSNEINAPLSGYSSPKELYEALKEDVFGPNATGDVGCVLEKISAEIPAPLQFKYLKDMIGPNDISLLTMKNFFKECGFNPSYQSITTFFRWLSFELEKSGGMAALIDKINFAENAISVAIDVCDSNLESLDGIPNEIKLNEIEAAKDKLLKTLTIGDVPPPVLFGCDTSPENKAIFSNYYTPIEEQSYDALMKMILQGINDIYNSDISKFKSIILKQDEDIASTQLLLNPTQNTPYADFREQNTKRALGQNISSNSTLDLRNTLSGDQKSLNKILNNLLGKNQFLAQNTVKLLPTQTGFTGYSIVIGSIEYLIIVNSSDSDFFGSQIGNKQIPSIPSYSTAVLAYTDSDNNSVPLYVKYLNTTYNLAELYEEVISDYSSTDPYVSGIKKYYNIEGISVSLYSVLLYNFLAGGGDFAKRSLLVIDNILNSSFYNFINNVDNFYSTETFQKMPLKDNEASLLQDEDKKKYRDNGLLITDGILENYKSSRKNYQCFIQFDDTPDPQQLSKLRALYQSLFNVLIMEALLIKFLNLNDNFDLSKEETIKKIIANGLIKAFNNSITNVGNLQKSFKDDIDLLYKLQTLEDKFKAGSTIINETKLTTTEEKIIYLSDFNFKDIIRRFKSRINLVQPDVLSKSTADSLKGYTVHDMYDSILYEDGIPYPVINGLTRGIIIQNYVDIKQNGQIFNEYEENKKGLLKVLPFISNAPGLGKIVDYEEAEQEGDTYIPGEAIYGFGDPKAYIDVDPESLNNFGNKFEQGIFGNFKAYPVYSKGFFTASPTYRVITVEGYDIDTFQPHQPFEDAPNQDIINWNYNFTKTQGKISKKDFEIFYKFLADSEPDDLFVDYYKENGPLQYYKKVAVGARVSLVLDIEPQEPLIDNQL